MVAQKKDLDCQFQAGNLHKTVILTYKASIASVAQKCSYKIVMISGGDVAWQ